MIVGLLWLIASVCVCLSIVVFPWGNPLCHSRRKWSRHNVLSAASHNLSLRRKAVIFYISVTVDLSFVRFLTRCTTFDSRRGFVFASCAHWTVWYIQHPIQSVKGAVYPKEWTVGMRGALPPCHSYSLVDSVLCKRGAFWLTAVVRSWAFMSKFVNVQLPS
jgi:hypothetical protein